MKQNNGVE